MMKFPLYSECPNCGGLANEHSENRLQCGCSNRRNKPIYEKLNELVGQSGEAAIREAEDLHSKIAPWCSCNLTPAEVNNAISIQAAVEVALQRAGANDSRGLKNGSHKIERLLEILILQSEHGKGTGGGASIPWDCSKCGTHVQANDFHNCAVAAKEKLAAEVLKRPGEYCADDDCNCGAAGNHATLPKELK